MSETYKKLLKYLFSMVYIFVQIKNLHHSIGKTMELFFPMYINYSRHKDVQYSISIFKRNRFDHLKCQLSLGVIVSSEQNVSPIFTLTLSFKMKSLNGSSCWHYSYFWALK